MLYMLLNVNYNALAAGNTEEPYDCKAAAALQQIS